MAAEKKDAYITSETSDMAPRGLLHALSEIEQFSVSEKASPIPEEALTTINLLSFFTVGFKTAIISGLVTALLSPAMFAVQEGIIPVFGDYELTFFDSAFVVAVTTSFSLGVALLIFMVFRRIYRGNVTKKAIHSLVGGIFSGAFFASIVVLVFYHILHYQYLTPEGIAYAVNFLPVSLKPGYRTAYWIFKFSEELIPSAYFQFSVSMLTSGIIASSIVVGRIRSKKYEAEKKKWG